MLFHVELQDEDDLDILYETLLYFITDHSPVEMKVTVEYVKKTTCESKEAHEESTSGSTMANDENTHQSQAHESLHLEIKDEAELDVFYETVLNIMTELSTMEMKITVEFDSSQMADSEE